LLFGTVEAFQAVVVSLTPGVDAGAVVGNVNAMARGFAGVAVGITIAAADRVVDRDADLWTRPALTGTMAVTIPFRTVLSGLTIIIALAFSGYHTGTAMSNIDAGNGGETGVIIGLSVAAADRGKYFQAGSGPRPALTGTVAVARRLGTV